MGIVTIILLGVLVLVVVWAVMIYNSLVQVKHNVSKAWANIDVLLKQRHDELPKLVEVCRQHMQFESSTLEKIITALKGRGLPILLAGMEAPRNLGKDYVDQFRALYADLAQRYDLILYPFFLDGVALDDKYTLGDRLHPNAEGVARIVDGILPKVEELLARVQASKG